MTPPGATAAFQYPVFYNRVELGFDGGLSGDFTTAYSWDLRSICGKWNDLDEMIQNGVTDPLLLQYLSPFPYYSADFNIDSMNDPYGFYGNPGWVDGSGNTNPEDYDLHHTVAELFTSLTTATGNDGQYTRNFYWYGHGQPNWIGNHLTGNLAVRIGSGDVALALGNYSWQVGNFPPSTSLNHPYRFVFIDGCDAQKSTAWAEAFGILPRLVSYDEAIANPQGASAILGFTGDVAAMGPYPQTDYYRYTLFAFFTLWQGGESLQNCLANCNTQPALWQTWKDMGIVFPYSSDPSHIIPIGMPQAPILHRQGTLQKFYGYPGITRTSIAQ